MLEVQEWQSLAMFLMKKAETSWTSLALHPKIHLDKISESLPGSGNAIYRTPAHLKYHVP